MNLSAFEIALIAGGFTIVGVLLGTIITYRFALRLSDIADKRLVGTKLREAFAPELATLHYPPEGITIEWAVTEILKKSFDKHYTAVSEFRRFLSGKELTAFNKAWRTYYGYDDNDESFHYTFFEKYHRTSDPNGVKKTISNIENLLIFTEPKKT